ncbi:protein DpdG [Paraburkholderia sp. J7]|uniref:protein DpdG n=1 Tax=Paraburkholderia sp. J7 TaxID=2805438 RepID=UPI002AB647B0|nr:protein DpdG [Paraburkholderia sp. J7]
MTVLTNFPAIPNRIAIACEYLQDAGASGISREQFDSQLSPWPPGNDEEERTGTSMAREVLRELEALGLAVEAPSGIGLAGELPLTPMSYGDWLEWLIPWATERLSDLGKADLCRQSGVPLAFAWLLSQDSRRPIRSAGAHVELLQQQFGNVDALGFNMRNDQLFQNLIYWARYLGYAETIGLRTSPNSGGSNSANYVIPDPTRAIRRVLPQIFSATNEMQISTFVERLADLLPVLEEGGARFELERRFTGALRRAEQHFSIATSLALTRLENEGILQLVSESDADRWVIGDWTDARYVTRLLWLGAQE